MNNYRRTPDPKGHDFIVLASDDTRLVRHNSLADAERAAESLAYANPSKSFRTFVAHSEVNTRRIPDLENPNRQIFLATPHDTLLVLVQFLDGAIAKIIVGAFDGKAFTASTDWLAKRMGDANDLAVVNMATITTGKYEKHLIAMLSLIVRTRREYEGGHAA